MWPKKTQLWSYWEISQQQDQRKVTFLHYEVVQLGDHQWCGILTLASKSLVPQLSHKNCFTLAVDTTFPTTRERNLRFQGWIFLHFSTVFFHLLAANMRPLCLSKKTSFSGPFLPWVPFPPQHFKSGQRSELTHPQFISTGDRNFEPKLQSQHESIGLTIRTEISHNREGKQTYLRYFLR